MDVDFQKGSKLSGSGFPLYMGKGATLERYLINAMIEHHIQEFSFKEVFPPVLMKKESMILLGQLPSLRRICTTPKLTTYILHLQQRSQLCNIHMREIISEDELPVYYVAYLYV